MTERAKHWADEPDAIAKIKLMDILQNDFSIDGCLAAEIAAALYDDYNYRPLLELTLIGDSEIKKAWINAQPEDCRHLEYNWFRTLKDDIAIAQAQLEADKKALKGPAN